MTRTRPGLYEDPARLSARRLLELHQTMVMLLATDVVHPKRPSMGSCTRASPFATLSARVRIRDTRPPRSRGLRRNLGPDFEDFCGERRKLRFTVPRRQRSHPATVRRHGIGPGAAEDVQPLRTSTRLAHRRRREPSPGTNADRYNALLRPRQGHVGDAARRVRHDRRRKSSARGAFFVPERRRATTCGASRPATRSEIRGAQLQATTPALTLSPLPC